MTSSSSIPTSSSTRCSRDRYEVRVQMIIVAVVITAVLVFVIAAVAIGRETHRLDAVPPAPPFELHEAVEWISERLPEDVRAQITYEDVRDLVMWHLDDLERRGVTPTAGPDGSLVILDESDSVDTLTMTAVERGRDIDPAHIRAVLDGELAYLEEIGAIGPLATDNQDTATDPRP